MSIPTTEITQARQDALRARVDAGVWGGLRSEEIRDRVMRTLNALEPTRPHLEEYLLLFNPLVTGARSQFDKLRVEEQRAFLDVATLRPGLGDVLALRDIIDLMVASHWSDSVRDAVTDYVTWPRRVPEGLGAGPTAQLRGWRTDQHAMRLHGLALLLRHEEFSRRSREEQTQMLKVLHCTEPVTAETFHELLDPATTRWAPGTVSSGTRPLFSESLLGRVTLLEALHRLATQTPHAEVGVRLRPNEEFLARPPFTHEHADDARRRIVLGGVLREVTRPDEGFYQSNRNTCAATSMLHRLARVRPAEYARIAHELVTTTRSRLQNGDNISALPDARPFDSSNRTASERLTQAAVSDYWTGGTMNGQQWRPRYHNTAPPIDGSTKPPDPPDSFDEGPPDFIDRFDVTAQALFGQRFHHIMSGFVAPLRAHFAAHPDVPIFCDMHWSDEGYHEIDVLSIDPPEVVGGRVRFWNPWGGSRAVLYEGLPIRHRPGVGEDSASVPTTPLGGIERRTEDSAHGVQSMLIHQFELAIRSAAFPQE